jgi:hypothetical protein
MCDPAAITWYANDIDPIAAACLAVNAQLWGLGPRVVIGCGDGLDPNWVTHAVNDRAAGITDVRTIRTLALLHAATPQRGSAAQPDASAERMRDCCATLIITTGATFTMPTTIPANRTARSVKCRLHWQGAGNAWWFALHNGPRALRVGVRETGTICGLPSPGGSPSPGSDISHVRSHSP